jgi:hypothetical protein
VLREEGKRVEKEVTKRKKGKGEPAASLLRRHNTTSSLLPLAAVLLPSGERHRRERWGGRIWSRV